MFLGPKIIIYADFLGVRELNVKLIFGVCFSALHSIVSEVRVFRGVLNSHRATWYYIYATCLFV